MALLVAARRAVPAVVLALAADALPAPLALLLDGLLPRRALAVVRARALRRGRRVVLQRRLEARPGRGRHGGDLAGRLEAARARAVRLGRALHGGRTHFPPLLLARVEAAQPGILELAEVPVLVALLHHSHGVLEVGVVQVGELGRRGRHNSDGLALH